MKNIIHRLDFNLQIGDNTNEHQLLSPRPPILVFVFVL